jgi:integrase
MRRIHVPDSVTHRYRLYPPSGSNSWRVMKLEDGKWRTVKNETIVAIVRQFKAGSLSAEDTRTQLNLAIEALYKADGVKVSRVASNKVNSDLCEEYIKTVIDKKRDAKPGSKEAARNYLKAAVRAIGELSLLVADKEALEAVLDKEYPDQRRRKAVSAINALLKHAKRDIRLDTGRIRRRDVRYIPFDKVKPVLDRLPNEAWRVCVQMALYTGLRIGELFALERRHKKQWGLYVEWQVMRDGTKDEPKNGKTRSVAVFKEALKVFDKWTMLKHEISLQERKRAARIVESACRRAYPNNPEWHLCFHDLRHSYAIAALEKGMNLEWIARQLGNRIEVTERHYTGHVQTAAMEQAAFKILNAG